MTHSLNKTIGKIKVKCLIRFALYETGTNGPKSILKLPPIKNKQTTIEEEKGVKTPSPISPKIYRKLLRMINNQ